MADQNKYLQDGRWLVRRQDYTPDYPALLPAELAQFFAAGSFLLCHIAAVGKYDWNVAFSGEQQECLGTRLRQARAELNALARSLWTRLTVARSPGFRWRGHTYPHALAAILEAERRRLNVVVITKMMVDSGQCTNEEDSAKMLDALDRLLPLPDRQLSELMTGLHQDVAALVTAKEQGADLPASPPRDEQADGDEPPPPGAEEWAPREPEPHRHCCVELLDPEAEFNAKVFGRNRRLLPDTEYKIIKVLRDVYLKDERLDNAELASRSGVPCPDRHLRSLREADPVWRAAILANGNSKPGRGKNTRNWWAINPDACPPPDFPDFDPTSPE